MKVHLAAGFGGRLRGLLGRSSLPGSTEALLIAPCSDVHTFGMSRAIDLAFLDEDGKVLLSRRGVPAGKRLKCPCAAFALERFASDEDWLTEGELTRLELGSEVET